jgi:hypothetical protein
MSASDFDFTKNRLLARRGLLKNVGLMALLAPALRMRDAGAAGEPRRVILLYRGNGPMNVIGPVTNGSAQTNFTLHDWWSPLEPYKAEGIFLSHMAPTLCGNFPRSKDDIPNGHGIGGQTYSGYGTGDTRGYLCNGRTIDQVIGERLQQKGAQGATRSVVWGLQNSHHEAFHSGPLKPIPPNTNPVNAWTEMFSQLIPAGTTDEAKQIAARAFARRKSILDFMKADCLATKDALGREGMPLLESHCNTIREMETALQTQMNGGGAGGVCTKPEKPTGASAFWSSVENQEAKMEAFASIIAATLSCQLTHVIGFQLCGQASRATLPSKYAVPSTGGTGGYEFHNWTHKNTSSQQHRVMGIFQKYYSTQVAVLLKKLKERGLLHSTLVVDVSEMGGFNKEGTGIAVHNPGGVPVMLYGGTAGGFKPGRYIKGKSKEENSSYQLFHKDAGVDMARILISVMHYMGLTDVHHVGVSKELLGVDLDPLPSLYA